MWWEKPYKGGPMVVPAAKFPRPLYPPDAARQGKQPSVDGADVEAYKRTLWRAGRWPGPASAFDRAFSNAFSHGKSGGNVSDSGIAGFQRQMGIQPTGWVGQTSFNTLASIRVPEGHPHAGEMAMDANAASLIAEAYATFHAPPPPKETQRERALDAAIGHLGYTESPPDSNHTTYGAWYGMDYQPWCAMFCAYLYEVEVGGSPSFARGSRYSYCPYIVADARARRNGLSLTSSPTRGDLVVFDWESSGSDEGYDHIGFFERWTGPYTFTSIEGNTAVGDDSNGGEVMRRERDLRAQSTVFVRVAEP